MVARPIAGDQRLLAYWTAGEAVPPTVAELRTHLAAHLPDYMVPSAFVRLADTLFEQTGAN